MPSDSKHNTPDQEEIGLVYLSVKIGGFLKKALSQLIKLIGSSLVFLLRKWYYLVSAVVLTLLVAIILDTSADAYYHSELVLRSNATGNQPVMSSVNRLGRYATEKNYTALSEDLNLSLEEASTIKGIETFWYYDLGGDGIVDGVDTEGIFLSDTSVVKIDTVFVIRASIYDPAVLRNLESGLLSYLGTVPFLEALNTQRLADLEGKLQQVKYEIEKLDSLQKREYYTNPDDLRQKDGQIVFTSEKSIRMYHPEMFWLLQSKQDWERHLNVYKEVVTVVEKFSIPNEPDNGIIQYARELIWYFIGLALLLAIIIHFRKKIWI